MTNEEKDLLIAYLVDAGDIDPDGDVEAQFLEWRQVRERVVSSETHYQAILEASRVRQRNYQRGYRTGGSVRWYEGAPPDALNQYQGGMCISGAQTRTERTPRRLISPLGPDLGGADSAVWRYVHFTLALV